MSYRYRRKLVISESQHSQRSRIGSESSHERNDIRMTRILRVADQKSFVQLRLEDQCSARALIIGEVQAPRSLDKLKGVRWPAKY